MVLVTTDCKFYVSPSLCSYPGELGLVTHHALLLLNAGTTGVAAFRETICSSNLDVASLLRRAPLMGLRRFGSSKSRVKCPYKDETVLFDARYSKNMGFECQYVMAYLGA